MFASAAPLWMWDQIPPKKHPFLLSITKWCTFNSFRWKNGICSICDSSAWEVGKKEEGVLDKIPLHPVAVVYNVSGLNFLDGL